MNCRTIHLAGHDPEANLAIERALFERARGGNQAICLYYINSPSIVMGRNNSVGQWVNSRDAEADGVPVLRRFSGGGTVYHDINVLNYSFIAPRPLIDKLAAANPGSPGGSAYINVFRNVVIQALSRSGPGFHATRVSDISLNGLKVSGNAQRIAGNLILHHGTIMRRSPLDRIVRYLPIPPDRSGITHKEFITGLVEQGREIPLARLKGWITAEFWAALETL